jgi:uncharacterized protein (TIGR02231 family)
MMILDTQIVAATVYLKGARITRKGTISLKRGKHQLEIEGLSLQMHRDSARASAKATVPSRLLGMQIQRRFYVENPIDKVNDLEKRLESLQDEANELQAQIDLINKERSQVEAISGHSELYATGLISGEADFKTLVEIFKQLREQSEHLYTNGHKLQVKKRDVDQQIYQTQNQLEQLRNSRSKERYSAYVDVEMLDDGDLTVEFNYLEMSASWKPLYDYRLKDNQGQYKLEISYLAQVSQKADEDWVDVMLNLSTARPTLAFIKPELDPWYISPRQELWDMAPAPMHAGFDVAAESSVDDLELDKKTMKRRTSAMIKSEEVGVQVDSSGLSVSYKLPGKVNIPADGSPHKVNITSIDLSPSMKYVTAPRIVEAVYRQVSVKNDSVYTFLPGQVNLFFGEEYLGSTEIELIAPKGELNMFFGVEDRIKIERELIRQEVDKRIIGGKRRHQIGYEIRLENLLNTEVNINLQDQIPVSEHEDIKIRLVNIDPKLKNQSELNVIDWELYLQKQAKITIRYDYEVEYPQKMVLSGPVY